MKIYNDIHYNKNCLTIENSNLKIKVIPEIGFKIASISYKNTEFLFQPTKLEYTTPVFGDPFSNYDTSGLDEMIPTIDSCNYDGIILPDHGDVWSMPWDIEISEDSIIGRVDLVSLPLKFEKKISFSDENTILMDYKVKNNSTKDYNYLWALHGLNNFNEYTEIILPQSVNKFLDVINNEVIDKKVENLLSLNNYEDGKSYKFYILDELEKGECGLYYKDLGLKYIIRFDKDINPYLGLWITKGGFKGEYNCALEPSNGFYDSLSLAKQNNKYQKILPLEERKWKASIEISEVVKDWI